MANLIAQNTSMKYLKGKGVKATCRQPKKIERVAIQLVFQQLNDIMDHGPITPNQKSF